MNATIIKNKIVKDIEYLNDSNLKEVLTFISYIKNRDEIDPTLEIVENEDFYNSVKQGIDDLNSGKFQDWNSL